MQNNYLFKDVIIGLYADYLNYYNSIDNLKRYLLIDSRIYKDFNIKIESHSKRKIESLEKTEFISDYDLEIYIELVKKCGLLRQKLIKLLSISNPTYMLIKDRNSKYFSCFDDIEIANTNKFSNGISEIINSDFVKNSNYAVVKKLNEDRLYLNFNLNFININKFIGNSNIYKFSGNFYPNLGKLEIETNLTNDIVNNKINEILNCDIPMEMLNQYIVNKIKQLENGDILYNIDNIDIKKNKLDIQFDIKQKIKTI